MNKISTIHRISAMIATSCVATFFSSTLIVELFGSTESIQLIKHLVVFPGLFILVPAIALTGATGAVMGKKRKGKVIERKSKRMPFIAFNGIVILIPAAYFLNQWAQSGQFDFLFYAVQALELAAGGVNLFLMFSNIKDGMKFRPRKK